jgi:hypothetical protein
MRHAFPLILVALFVATTTLASAEDSPGGRLLLLAHRQDFQSILPSGTQLLHDPVSIEKFLDAMDGSPPRWADLHGPHGSHTDERLFALNRERDRRRVGQEGLTQRITFLWQGRLSSYHPDRGGFLVAIGPEVIPTKWGLVRFKVEGLPAELVAVPPPASRDSLRAMVARDEGITVIVAMTGRLVPEESILYDFAHENPGQGMVMPVVRVERIDYLLIQ